MCYKEKPEENTTTVYLLTTCASIIAYLLASQGYLGVPKLYRKSLFKGHFQVVTPAILFNIMQSISMTVISSLRLMGYKPVMTNPASS